MENDKKVVKAAIQLNGEIRSLLAAMLNGKDKDRRARLMHLVEAYGKQCAVEALVEKEIEEKEKDGGKGKEA